MPSALPRSYDHFDAFWYHVLRSATRREPFHYEHVKALATLTETTLTKHQATSLSGPSFLEAGDCRLRSALSLAWAQSDVRLRLQTVAAAEVQVQVHRPWF